MDTGLCCVIVKEVNASMLKKKLYLNLHQKGVSAKSFESFFHRVESNQNRVIWKRLLCLRNNYAT